MRKGLSSATLTPLEVKEDDKLLKVNREIETALIFVVQTYIYH